MINFQLCSEFLKNNSNVTGPIIPSMQGNPNLEEYRCLHCKRFLFKGNINKLNMPCYHCQWLIIVDSNKVIIETDES